MFKFRFQLTFNAIYLHPQWLHVLLFWNYVPFLAYLILLISETLFASRQLVQVTTLGVVAVINIAYQLYLWEFGFFAAQDFSEGQISVPELNLSHMLDSWSTKLRIAAIRILYYLPLAIPLAVIVYFFDIPTLASNLATIFNTGTLGLKIGGSLSFAFMYYLLVENVILPAAYYQYSYTNSVLAAFNLVKIAKFIAMNIKDLLALLFISFTFYSVMIVVFFISSVLLLIPIVGAILFAILSGFMTSWHVLFIPALQGQIWQQTKLHD
jgi:hypothetical protein